jgi:hypothetical protein
MVVVGGQLLVQASLWAYYAAWGRPRVALMPDGLFVWKRRTRPELIPWSDIANARGSAILGSAWVTLKNCRRIRFAYEFRPRSFAAEFARLVRERISMVGTAHHES